MGRKRKPRKIWLLEEMVISKAFTELTGKSVQVLMLFHARQKFIHLGGSNYAKDEEWKIIFTYADAKTDFGFSAKQFRHAIDQLVAHGFIDITEYGGGLQRSATVFEISERWTRYGEENFEEKTRIKDGKRRWPFYGAP